MSSQTSDNSGFFESLWNLGKTSLRAAVKFVSSPVTLTSAGAYLGWSIGAALSTGRPIPEQVRADFLFVARLLSGAGQSCVRGLIDAVCRGVLSVCKNSIRILFSISRICFEWLSQSRVPVFLDPLHAELSLRLPEAPVSRLVTATSTATVIGFASVSPRVRTYLLTNICVGALGAYFGVKEHTLFVWAVCWSAFAGAYLFTDYLDETICENKLPPYTRFANGIAASIVAYGPFLFVNSPIYYFYLRFFYGSRG